jgi:hypothetical protein
MVISVNYQFSDGHNWHFIVNLTGMVDLKKGTIDDSQGVLWL